jgi:hypothetical protein
MHWTAMQQDECECGFYNQCYAWHIWIVAHQWLNVLLFATDVCCHYSVITVDVQSSVCVNIFKEEFAIADTSLLPCYFI